MNVRGVLAGLLVLVLVGFVSSEEVDDRPSGGIGQLYDAVTKMTGEMASMKKIQEDIPLKFEEQFTRWGGVTILGMSVFLTLLYFIILFLDHIRRRKLKKTREELIEKLNKELETLKTQYIVDLEQIHGLNTDLHIIREAIKELTNVRAGKHKYLSTGFMLGYILAFISFIIFERGVF